MKRTIYLMMAVVIMAGSVSAVMVDDFEDVSTWSASYPAGLYYQGTAPAEQVYEGSGSMVVDYTPFIGDGIYMNKDLPASLDLSAEAAAGGHVSIMMYVEAAGDHAAITSLKLSTAYYNSEFIWDAAWGATYDAGWNELIIPLADFVESGSTVPGTADWGNINRIEMVTGAYPDGAPTDVTVDAWQVVVPEPMTIALLGLGGLFLRRRK